ncbi:MAG: hypothetical protein ACK5O2_10745 [Microthrixaceae bacterium]
MHTNRFTIRAVAGILIGALTIGIAWGTPAGAQQSDDVEVSATVNGRPVEGAGSNDPVKLQPLDVTDAEIEVTNTTDEDVTVKRARLFGKAFGLTFVAYDAVVQVPVPAGETAIIEIPIEFVDLERQATGLLPGGFALYDDDRQVIGQQDFVIDVRGSATSALGLFGIFIAVATVIGLIGIYLGIKRRTLEPRRPRRAVRFAFVGLGMGLTAVVALAVFRVVAPTPIVWIPLTLLPLIGGALLGFLSPGPLRIDDESDLDDMTTLEEREYLDELDRIAAEQQAGTGAATEAGEPPGGAGEAEHVAPSPTDGPIDLTRETATDVASGSASKARGHFNR